MAFGTKTNERPGTRAQVRWARVSAYKAREVLDLGHQVTPLDLAANRDPEPDPLIGRVLAGGSIRASA